MSGMNRWLLCLLVALPLLAATNAPVDYRRLGYVDEKFTWEGALFTGEAVQTNRAGRLIARRHFRDGRLHGRTEEYHTNGVRSVCADFVDGSRHGTNIYWNPDGSLLKSQRWEQGRLVESTHKEDLE